MKKLTLVATAVMSLVCASGAIAQSTSPSTTNVTLYGLVDAGFNHVTGLKSGSFNGIASGIMEGSRWGLKGTEDLGGGYKAIFTLESRFEVDTGSVSNTPASGLQLPDRIGVAVRDHLAAPFKPTAATIIPAVNNLLASSAFGVNIGPAGNRLFDRQAFVGLVTPFGAVTLGRQYTPAYLVSAAFDASHTESSLAVGQVASLPAAFDIRLSNTVQYGIRTSGVTATLMYGAGEVAGSSSASRFLGIMAMYNANGFGLGFGHNEKNNEAGQKSLTNNIFGASVDLGPGTLFGQYATIKDENPSGLASIGAGVTALSGSAVLGTAYQNAYNESFHQDARLMHIGYRLTTGPHTIVAAFNRLDDRRAANADTDSYGATYTYALSKRTNLNAVLTRFNNKGTGQIAPGGAGFLGGVTATAGTGSTNLAFGIRHTF